MNRLRKIPLIVVLVVLIAGVGTLTSVEHPENPSSPPSVLNIANSIESTALYCTGLTSARYGAVGHVTLVNTTAHRRQVTINVSSNTGGRASEEITLSPYSRQAVSPSQLVTGDSFGLTALVSGGGVVGVISTAAVASEAPCITTGVKSWYGAGFDTVVGSDAALSMYNPTATPAVVNVTTYSPSGFSAPAPFQGLAIGPHAEVRIDLGTQIVATSNIGVRINVLRGVVVVTGVQRSGSIVSFNSGSTTLATMVLLPRVTTANHAVAQIRIANPGSQPADVTVNVSLHPYSVNPLTETVPAYGSALVTITPNSSIPASGYASLQLTSTQPVFSALVTGTAAGLSWSSPGDISSTFVITDIYGRGYDAATVSNVSDRPITIDATVLRPGQSPTRARATLAASATSSIVGLFGQSLKGQTVMLSTSDAALQLTLTLASTPAGTFILGGLDGR